MRHRSKIAAGIFALYAAACSGGGEREDSNLDGGDNVSVSLDAGGLADGALQGSGSDAASQGSGSDAASQGSGSDAASQGRGSDAASQGSGSDAGPARGDAATGRDASAGNDAGGSSNDAASASGDGGYDFWPNPLAPANSDPWLRDHHDELKVMRPRVLVLDVQRVGRPIETVTAAIIDAIATGSRYHGYADANAPSFLQYQIEKIVDLRDPSAEYPSFWPPGPNFDVGQLYTAAFAPRYGFADPDRPGQFLTLCQLFERGTIHELWIAAEAGVRAVYENQSRMQRYDASRNKIPGSFQDCTNGCYNDPGKLVNCKVSTRMQEVNKGRGSGCFGHAAGHAMENMADAMPYLGTNGDRFFNFGLRQRYSLPYDRLYDVDCFLGQAPGDRKCTFPSPTTLQYTATSGQSFTFTGYGQGCGDVHHKPNIYGSGVVAAHTCEHYGLRDGANGADLTSLYSQAGSLADQKMAEYEGKFPDCDGGWNVYMRQSMPGLGNHAFAADGSPMKNWWPFLFY